MDPSKRGMPRPPSPQDELTAHCLELLGGVGPARARRMFGGRGLYIDDCFVGLIAADQLYLKVDDATRARFEAQGCQPFIYRAKDREVRLGFYSVPAEAMESSGLMQPWARLALEAALRARQPKTAGKAKPKTKPKTKATAGKP